MFPLVLGPLGVDWNYTITSMGLWLMDSRVSAFSDFIIM
jgi:hypothetical protein